MVVRVSSEMAIEHVATNINVGFSGVLVKRGEHSVERGNTNSVVWLVFEGVIRGNGETAMTACKFGGDREEIQEQRRSRSKRLAMNFEEPFEQGCSYNPGTQCYSMGFGRSSTERKNDQ